MSRMRPGRIVMLCALALAVAASAAKPVVAYNFHGVKWPDGVVPYFNAATDQSWAVATAVRAWNESGAHVRFVAVPRSQAKLVIEDDSRKVYCSEGHASVGYARNARVVIFPAHGITHACNPYWAVRVVAHELGHVLGLVHENRYCATMNSVGSMHGGAQCKPQSCGTGAAACSSPTTWRAWRPSTADSRGRRPSRSSARSMRRSGRRTASPRPTTRPEAR